MNFKKDSWIVGIFCPKHDRLEPLDRCCNG